jgi:hypothetical protein
LVNFFVSILCGLVKIMGGKEVNMNRPDAQLQNNSRLISPISYTDLAPTRRLIVLVPDADLDYAAAARRVWNLAGGMESQILFIGLCNDTAEEPGLRRQLITMTAMVQDGKASAEAYIETGTNWVTIVKRNYLQGDLVVCFAEQRAGLIQKPLSQVLQSSLKIPVYIISGIFWEKPGLNWRSQVTLWAGHMGIVLAFCLLQFRIIQLPKDGFQSLLLVLSILPEFWLIWVWNNLFS